VGGRSFEPLGIRPDERAMENLLSLHPEYLEVVGEFISSDPLATHRKGVLSALRSGGIELG
jgi:hypothetical protein